MFVSHSGNNEEHAFFIFKFYFSDDVGNVSLKNEVRSDSNERPEDFFFQKKLHMLFLHIFLHTIWSTGGGAGW